MQHFERPLRLAQLGDLEALRAAAAQARRRDQLDALLEVTAGLPDALGAWDVVWQALVVDAPPPATLQAALQRKVEAWGAALRARPALLRGALGLVGEEESWHAISRAVVDPRDSEAMRRELEQTRGDAWRELLDAGPGLIFAAVECNKYLPDGKRILQDVLCHFAHDPLAPWIAVELLRGYRGQFSQRWQQYDVNELLWRLEPLDAQMREPVLHRMLLEPELRRESHLTWLMEDEGRVPLRLLIDSLSDARRPVRKASREALVARGAQVLPAVWPTLEARGHQSRLATASLLERVPHERSIPVIERRLAQEASTKVRARLERALATCRLLSARRDAPPASMEAALAPLVAAQPGAQDVLGIDGSLLPRLRWRDGEPLKPATQAWFLTQLLCDPGQRGGMLWTLRERLDDARCARLCAALLAQHQRPTLRHRRSFDEERGLLMLRGALGDGAQLEELIQHLLHQRHNSHWFRAAFEALCWRGGSDTAYWLDHIARKGPRRALRRRARELLTEMARDAGLDVDGFLEHHPFDHGFDRRGRRVLAAQGARLEVALQPGGALALIGPDGAPGSALGDADDLAVALRDAPLGARRALATALSTLQQAVSSATQGHLERLERAMVEERAWSGARWRACFLEHPVLRALACGLLFAVSAPGAEASVFILDADGQRRDLEGQTLATLADAASVRLVHPVTLSPTDLTRWQARLEAMGLRQPFTQLHRDHHRWRADADPLAALRRRRLYLDYWDAENFLIRRGYERMHFRSLMRTMADGTEVHIENAWVPELETGILTEVEFERGGQLIPPVEVAPVTFSEALRDLHQMLKDSAA